MTANLAPDDPKRADLLRLYGDTRAALVAPPGNSANQRIPCPGARGAAGRAAAIEAGLAARVSASRRRQIPPMSLWRILSSKCRSVGRTRCPQNPAGRTQRGYFRCGPLSRDPRPLDGAGRLLPKLQSQLSLLPKRSSPAVPKRPVLAGTGASRERNRGKGFAG